MFAAASLVIPVSANAFTFHLLFVVPITWPFGTDPLGLGSGVGRLVVAVPVLMTATAVKPQASFR
jgi:hypothetical protein